MTAGQTLVDVRNPHRYSTPAWRWGRATELLRLQLEPEGDDDTGVIAAWIYLRYMSVAENQQQIETTRLRYPLVAAAHRIYRDAGQTRRSLEELLSQRKTLTVISEATTLIADVIRACRALFLDINSRTAESPRSSTTFTGAFYAESFDSEP